MGETKDRARECALRVLTEADKGGIRTDRLLQSALAEDSFSATDKAFVRMLVSVCVRRRLTLDHVIARFTEKDGKMKPLVRNVLRMGIAQILYLDRVPDAAAVSSSVELMKTHGFKHLTGFVNGVLRSVVREKDTIDFPSISIRYSTPDWICKLLTKTYGEAEAEQILAAHLAPAWVTLRLDRRLPDDTRKASAQRILEETVAVYPKADGEGHPFSPDLLRFRRAGDVTALTGYAEGLWMVQDAAASVVVPCAGIKKGDTVIDVCASPGGKALQCAELAGDQESGGRVYAFDLTEEKCTRIRENIARMHILNVTVAAQDARSMREDLKGTADVVLCDLPCSGLGVLKHKPEIKYRLKETDIDDLAALQKEILTSAVSYLKTGGVLIYGTCTLTKAENEDIADWAKETLPLKPDDLTPFLPDVLRERVDRAHTNRLTILPQWYETDGAFVARFVKK